MRGDPDFIMGEVSCGDYLGVLSEDPITANLLQARLIELGNNTSVEIVDRSRARVAADSFFPRNSSILEAFG